MNSPAQQAKRMLRLDSLQNLGCICTLLQLQPMMCGLNCFWTTCFLCHRELLSYTKTAVTRNQGEKKINSLLDHVSTSSNMRLLQVRETLSHKIMAVSWTTAIRCVLCRRST